MTCQPITLEELLAGRDRRAALQESLLKEYNRPLISFTVNMPGPIKLCPQSLRIHEAGVEAIKGILGGNLLHYQLQTPSTGPEGYFLCRGEGEELKAQMCVLEEEHPLGRLFDIDVLIAPGKQISRETLGYTPRKCLICSGDGAACARSRAHTLPELLAKIDQLLEAYAGLPDNFPL